MSDPISREELSMLKALANCRDKEEMLAVIHAAPTVDAEPVVRCKDCIWFFPGEGDLKAYCKNHAGLLLTDFDGFCHHGKRDQEGGEQNEAD